MVNLVNGKLESLSLAQIDSFFHIEMYLKSEAWHFSYRLTRIALSIVLGSYGVERGYYTTFNESLQNPMSEQLLTLAPPDGNPPLEDLVTNFTICPYDDDYKELEGQVNK